MRICLTHHLIAAGVAVLVAGLAAMPVAAQGSTDTVRAQVTPLAPVVTAAEALKTKLDEVGFTHR